MENKPISQVFEMHEASHRENTKAISHALLVRIQSFDHKICYINDIDENFCRNFASYLAEEVSCSSATTYLNKLHAILEYAKTKKMLKQNPMPLVRTLVSPRTKKDRVFLTTEEIHALENTECPHKETKRAFLFACLTGLRISDIETLDWSDIRGWGEKATIVKRQVKTGHDVEIPLNELTQTYLGEPQKTGRVFKMMSRTVVASDLKQWAKAAGINKHLTFHVSRHTFATQSISAGVGIYTVSKLCGHTSVKTTQIYAHMMDRTLRDGIDRLTALLHNEPKISKETPTNNVIIIVVQANSEEISKLTFDNNLLNCNQLANILKKIEPQ